MLRLLQVYLQNRFVKALLKGCILSAALLFLAMALFLGFFERKAFDYDIAAVGRAPRSTEILDATGTRIGSLHASKGTDLPLSEISSDFLNALIAREDSRFWHHHGVDHIGLVRANIRNIREKRLVQGASTITMQLSRMTFNLRENREKSFARKFVEMAISRRIERKYTKKEILRFYVNRVFLGTGIHGIVEAADGYFGKHPSQLNLAESAMLAGIIRAPNGFSPFRSPDAALREMRMTLDRMAAEGMITEAEANTAKKMTPRILPQERWMKRLRQKLQNRESSWFTHMIESKLAELIPGAEGYGGFTIKTTIDHRIQHAATNAVHKWLSGVERVADYSHPAYPALDDRDEPAYLQGAGVVVDNFNGAIRALVGGRNYAHSGFNRAIHKNRQAGSIIKPLVYATAFETGMFPGANVSDERIQPGEFPWWQGPAWDPVNADGQHSGLKPAETGLVQSRNTMTVRVGEAAGIDNVVTMLKHAGIAGDDVEKDPQLYIGNLNVSLLSVTSAYSAFPMNGKRFEPYLIESILDRDGSVLYRHQAERYQVFSPEAAWLTSSILQKVLESGGSGGRLREWGFDAPAGGKTGTTNDFVDAWFIGYTSRLTGGFWVGLDQPTTILDGAYGGRIAMPMWKDTMLAAQQVGYPMEAISPPMETFQMRICRNSGLLASPACESHGCAYTEVVPSSMIPRDFCQRESK